MQPTHRLKQIHILRGCDFVNQTNKLDYLSEAAKRDLQQVKPLHGIPVKQSGHPWGKNLGWGQYNRHAW